MDGGEEERNLLTVATQHLLSIGGCPALLAEFCLTTRRFIRMAGSKKRSRPWRPACCKGAKNKSNLWLEVARAEGRKQGVFFFRMCPRLREASVLRGCHTNPAPHRIIPLMAVHCSLAHKYIDKKMIKFKSSLSHWTLSP